MSSLLSNFQDRFYWGLSPLSFLLLSIVPFILTTQVGNEITKCSLWDLLGHSMLRNRCTTSVV